MLRNGQRTTTSYPAAEEAHAQEMGMRKKLADKGWLALSWPKEYGGSDASVMQQVIFTDEWSYAHAPGARRRGDRLHRPGNHGPRDGGAEERAHRRHSPRRSRLGPGLFGARVGFRPGITPDPLPSSKVMSGSSTARRYGPLRPTSPTGSSCWHAPTPMPPSTGALPCSSPT